MTAIALCLPWPPSSNNAYPTNRQGKRFLSNAGRDYTQRVAECVLQAGSPRIEGRVSVWYELFPPNRRKFDVAGKEKILSDALVKAGVIADDEQIDDNRQTRRGIVDEGEVHVWIAPYTDAAPAGED